TGLRVCLGRPFLLRAQQARHLQVPLEVLPGRLEDVVADADRQDSVLNAPAERSGAALLDALASLQLPAADFDHRAHLRAAWACLHDAPFDTAAARFTGL